jgi:hypothetical protein
LPAGVRPGLLTIRVAQGSSPADADLVVATSHGAPQQLKAISASNIPATTLTLVDEASGTQVHLATDTAPGPWASTTFAPRPGRYTVIADATSQSVAVTVEEGQTLLALETLAGHPATPQPTPSTVGGTPSEPAPPATPEAATTTPAIPQPNPPLVGGQSTPASPSPQPTRETTQVFQFSARDWAGGYADVVTEVYQRECVALYGVNSQFSSAALTFALRATGEASAQLVLTGLDDEWSGEVPIAVAVNGVVVYQGASGFASWDPSGATVAWSQIVIAIDADLLRTGPNEITVTNLADAANFGIPPYLLLAGATLTISPETGE